jgi:hypothetical protein
MGFERRVIRFSAAKRYKNADHLKATGYLYYLIKLYKRLFQQAGPFSTLILSVSPT